MLTKTDPPLWHKNMNSAMKWDLNSNHLSCLALAILLMPFCTIFCSLKAPLDLALYRHKLSLPAERRPKLMKYALWHVRQLKTLICMDIRENAEMLSMLSLKSHDQSICLLSCRAQEYHTHDNKSMNFGHARNDVETTMSAIIITLECLEGQVRGFSSCTRSVKQRGSYLILIACSRMHLSINGVSSAKHLNSWAFVVGTIKI